MFVLGNSTASSKGLMISAGLLSTGAVARGSSRSSVKLTTKPLERPDITLRAPYLQIQCLSLNLKFFPCNDMIKMHYVIFQKFGLVMSGLARIWNGKLWLTGSLGVTSKYWELP